MQTSQPMITQVTTLNYASDQQIADFLHSRLERALKKSHDPIAIALPGGSTPGPILQLLVRRPLDWSRISVFPTDDRDVPEDHGASNTGALRALLEPQGAKLSPLRDGLIAPHFALVWLGMGADGHIASLFPSAQPDPVDPLNIRRLTPDPLPPEAPYDRVTLTIPALLNCDEMVFVARGQTKRVVFEDALKGAHQLPIHTLLAARESGAKMPVTCFY